MQHGQNIRPERRQGNITVPLNLCQLPDALQCFRCAVLIQQPDKFRKLFKNITFTALCDKLFVVIHLCVFWFTEINFNSPVFQGGNASRRQNVHTCI